MTHPEQLAERFRQQGNPIRIEPVRLLLEEFLDMQRTYVLALEILLKESRNANSTGERVPD